MTRTAAAGTWFSRNRVAIQLQALSITAVLVIMVLAVSAVHFASRTEHGARALYQDSVIRLRDLSQLEILFEHQRRMVQAAPAEFDRERLGKSRQALAEAVANMRRLSQRMTENGSATDHALHNTLNAALPKLERAAAKVFDFAHHFAQERAQDVVQTFYEAAAGEIEQALLGWRDNQLRVADRELKRLREAAHDMSYWITTLALAALTLVGPISLLMIIRILRRFGLVTKAMRSLAAGDTSVAIPFEKSSDEVGEFARGMAVFKENALDLASAHMHLDAAVDNMVQGLCLFDADERLMFFNDRVCDIYGLPREKMRIGMGLRELADHVHNLRLDPTVTAEGLYLRYSTSRVRSGEKSWKHELTDGRIIAVTQRATASGGWVDTHEDITQRIAAERKVEQLALYDSLTGLANRVQFHAKLDEMLARKAQDFKALDFAVICLDLDGFKNVDDTLGHFEGDKLLGLVAQRLRACTRETAFVARLGGDEFALLLPKRDIGGPSRLAAAIIEELSQPYVVDGHRIVIGVSAGIAVHPAHGESAEALMKAADIAMYSAKAAGRGTFRTFEVEMDQRLRKKRALEEDLRVALDEGQFELHYQPIIDLSDDEIRGFEALLRWRHPERGLVPPNDFIPMAEETGLIVPLGEWVLREACFEAASWPSDVSVAVNLSAIQFRNAELPQAVFAALALSQLDPRRLELEITESILLADSQGVLDTLQKIKDYGVRIAMDDFGTGYSSLSYLHSFPFDKIKIDKSFVRNIETASALSIIRAVMNIATSLGMTTLAEGVETIEQLTALRAEKCDQVQGFLFSPAVPPARLPEMLVGRGADAGTERAARLIAG